MSPKRKISIRKVLQAFVTLVVTSGCLAAVLGASHMQSSRTVKDIHLLVRNGSQYPFLDKDALWKDLVTSKGIKEKKTRLSGLDIKSIERTAYQNPWVSKADVYIDNSQNLHIYVTQRTPVARICFENGQSFYLDASLRLLPLSEFFTYYTTIVTNVPIIKNDSLNRYMRSSIVKMVNFIERDTFWSAQIAQISLTPDLKFELIPVLGTHRIMFGDTCLMKEKFDNLFTFYKKVLNRIGWEKYQVLDLRFKDEVVASPTLPWTPPTKNAVSNMDWLKSIMDQAPVDSATPPVVKINSSGQQQPKMVLTAKVPVKAEKPVVQKATVVTKTKIETAPRRSEAKQKAETSKSKTKPDEQKAKYIYQGKANH